MKTSAGRRSDDEDKVTRRLQLVATGVASGRNAGPRYKIGFADNLFSNPKSTNVESRAETAVDRETEPVLVRLDILIALTALGGLALGYIIGKSRK